MKKRSQSRMVQMDLFASSPALPVMRQEPDGRMDGAPLRPVEAAADFERKRRKRSQAGGVPFVTGPVSDATAGPLSGEEAARVVRQQTIRCSGYRWQDGTACCKSCFDTVIRNGADRGHGYRAVLYGGAEYKGGAVCFACQRAIAP